ncbi:MAG: hypothetical protein WCA78_09135 [Rhizomicrobium sp.]
MSEFALPLSPRDRGWLDLRERLARAARDLHFSAVSHDAVNGPTLLVIAGNLAGLALSIPMRPTPPKTMSDGSGRLVDASTLFNTQILQRDMQTDGTATDVGEGR